MTQFLGPWAGHLTILAFPGRGQFDRCQARGRAVEFEPGNEMAMSLQGDWNETSSSTCGSFERHLLCHDECGGFSLQDLQDLDFFKIIKKIKIIKN